MNHVQRSSIPLTSLTSLTPTHSNTTTPTRASRTSTRFPYSPASTSVSLG
ncbi:hypothetical protein M3J09_013839 [Ascochyta lentis]